MPSIYFFLVIKQNKLKRAPLIDTYYIILLYYIILGYLII